MADIEDYGAGEEVDVDVAVDILHRGAPAPAKGHGQAAGIRDRRALVATLILEVFAGLRPRGLLSDEGRPGVGELFEKFFRGFRRVHG
jgi:hypothetical protein